MFSHNIYLTTTDSHSILNSNDKRINPAKNIYIGNHVWIGLNSMILKGAEIPNNCIIGASSIYSINSKGEPNSLYVGSPAKQIKHNINWNRKLL